MKLSNEKIEQLQLAFIGTATSPKSEADYDTLKEIQKKREDLLAEILKERGIELNIHGCGCCGSPWINLKIDGIAIGSLENFNLTMIQEDNTST